MLADRGGRRNDDDDDDDAMPPKAGDEQFLNFTQSGSVLIPRVSAPVRHGSWGGGNEPLVSKQSGWQHAISRDAAACPCASLTGPGIGAFLHSTSQHHRGWEVCARLALICVKFWKSD